MTLLPPASTRRRQVLSLHLATIAVVAFVLGGVCAATLSREALACVMALVSSFALAVLARPRWRAARLVAALLGVFHTGCDGIVVTDEPSPSAVGCTAGEHPDASPPALGCMDAGGNLRPGTELEACGTGAAVCVRCSFACVDGSCLPGGAS